MVAKTALRTIGLLYESTAGTTPSATTGARLIATNDATGMNRTREFIDTNTRRGNGFAAAPIAGVVNPSPGFVMPFEYRDLGYILRLALGNVATTAEMRQSNPTGRNIHTFTPLGGSGTLPTASIESFNPDINAGIRFAGYKINTVEFGISAQNEMTVTVNGFPQDANILSSASDDFAGKVTNPLTRVLQETMTATLGSTNLALPVIDVTVRLNNNIDGNVFGAGSLFRKATPEGLPSMEVEFSVLFEDNTFVNKAVNLDEEQLTLTFNGGDAVTQGTINMNFYEGQLVEGDENTGQTGTIKSFTYRNYFDNASQARPFDMALTNNVTTYATT